MGKSMASRPIKYIFVTGGVLSSLGNDVDAIVDGGVADKREGSTVVGVSAKGLFVLREGVVALDNLDSVARGWKGS